MRGTNNRRQGTYTEVTATVLPFPPLLDEHKENTHAHAHIHRATNTPEVWSHTEQTHKTKKGARRRLKERRTVGNTARQDTPKNK